MYTNPELSIEYIMASRDNFKTAANETHKIECILMKYVAKISLFC